MDLTKFENSKFKGKIESTVQFAEAIRRGDNPLDITLTEVVKEKFGVTLDAFYADLGIDPNYDTVQNIVSVPDVDARWIIPEFFRDAIRLGYRQAPIWPNIIAAEEQMKGLTQVLPNINMSDATPAIVAEGETIPLGSVSYGSKKFNAFKVGKGIQLTYEVIQHSSLNVVRIFLEDFGVKMGYAVDSLAIQTLLNGEQLDGSESAPVIGVETAGTKTYKDFLRIWMRMGRMGQNPGIMLGGETAAIDTWNLPEFKERRGPYAPENQLTLKNMPFPQNTNYYVHGNIPASQEIILNKERGIIKMNAAPLLVESEKIIQNQTSAFYATTSLGFAKLFKDATVVMDESIDFATNGFPDYMDVDAQQNVVFE